MIDTKAFYDYLLYKGFGFFAGVPDSLLKDFCACVQAHSLPENHIITANEGNAVAVAAGYHLACGGSGVVYMQNSGIGNAANPLLSLADEEVYGIPMLLIIGWRGEPNTIDEPQHKKQGRVTLALFQAMSIEAMVLEDHYQEQIDACHAYLSTHQRPLALIVKKNTFSAYASTQAVSSYALTREYALSAMLAAFDTHDFIVATTGKTSRELFELREKYYQGQGQGHGHSNDFLTVGAMGHAASIACGISMHTDKNVFCIDGDGAFLMHMGSLAVIAQNAKANFKYILINNGAHESVGGQPTVAFDIQTDEILKAVGFKHVYVAATETELTTGVRALKANAELSALIVYIKQGARSDLGRPTISPADNKRAFMKRMGASV